MEENISTDLTQDDELISWIRIGIVSGLIACIIYPVVTLVSLPRIPQVLLGAGFGPALATASIALAHIMWKYRRSPYIKLAAVFNSLSAVLITAMIIVQLAVNYSTSPSIDEKSGDIIRQRVWDIVLGLDVSYDIFLGIGTVLFAVNMIRDIRFGRIIGWTGVFVSLVPLLGANIYFFPDPPYIHGFPHVGLFTGLWYFAVVIFIIRLLRKDTILP